MSTPRILYQGPAGRVTEQGVYLFSVQAEGKVMGVTPGGPQNQPTPQEANLVMTAASQAFGPLKPWMVGAGFFLILLILIFLRLPFWLTSFLAIIATLVVIGWPAYKQFKAFEAMFAAREQITILLSEEPTQAVSQIVEINPTSQNQTLAIRQPTGIVVTGLPLADRVKLAGAVTRHIALQTMRGTKK